MKTVKHPGNKIKHFKQNNPQWFFRDSHNSDEPPVDYLITGGLDDLVKVWELRGEKLELKHNLEGHSLGVMSVAISSDGKSK